ncbi:MAG: TetR/AcrR family transcriptional regulator [Burkholderiales bacterium]|jgi:AcrR family transcriptional regulator|nr:TetR/AcrR family transcriptional regulator [Burkholderiales bacterium]HMM51215.1 TetR/AcrR family transcriptional regulator [Burkholderiaceae bacterium]
MTPQAPRRRKSARRAEILAAARQLFLERAFDAAAISEIAARAGCVEGTIYTYFRSKRDLFDEVLAEFYDRLIADIEPRLAAIEGTRDRLSYLIARHLQIAVDDPAFARLIVREVRSQSLYFGSKLHALNRRYSRFLLDTLRDGVARGELRTDLDLALARDLVFGGLEHHVWHVLGRQRRIDPNRLAATMVDLFLAGWAAPQGRDELSGLALRVSRLEQRLGG